jgi:GNAT superfamily N-acetyltransferase
MVSELVPTPVDLSTADRDFWKRYHEFRRVRHRESRPEDPLRPDDVEEMNLKRQDPFEIEHRYEISRGGTMLSMFRGDAVKPGTPEYETNKHLYWADIYVRPDERRRGIGSAWLPLIVELMESLDATILGLGSEEESGHAFLKWIGAEARFTGAENRLNLAVVDWDMLQRWAQEGQRRSPSTKLETYDGPMPESLWDDFAPQLSAMLNTVPFENLDHGEIVVTPDHMRDYLERMAMAGEIMHTILTREPDGVISGITDTRWAPYSRTIIHQGFTGVRPEARGRGIGKWIKAAMLLHMRELYPDAQWVSTDNAGSNAPMLAINKKLGFRQYRAGTEYQVSRERLAARVRSLQKA